MIDIADLDGLLDETRRHSQSVELDWCTECNEEWPCTAAQAHEAIKRLLSENGALRERLRSLEWAGPNAGDVTCPACGGCRPREDEPSGYSQAAMGHEADCWLEAEITARPRTTRADEGAPQLPHSEKPVKKHE